LKATTVVFSNELCSTFTAMSSRTLFSDHVCVCVYIYIYITSHRNGEVGGMEFLGVFSFSIYLTIQNCVVWLLHGSK